MSLEKVRDEVLEQARKQADALLRSARQEAESLEEQNTRRMEQEKSKTNTELAMFADELERQEISQVKLDFRNAMLRAKKDLIEQVIAKAEQKLSRQSPEEKKEFLGLLLKRGQAAMKIAYVYCNKNDAALVKKLGTFTVQGIEIPGGLILENEQKTVRLDMSYKNILERVREEHLTTIHKLLFASAAEIQGKQDIAKQKNKSVKKKHKKK